MNNTIKKTSRKLIDLTGKKFHRWTVMHEVERDNKGNRMWLCRCECGNENTITTSRLNSGNTKSCGCYEKDKVRERIRERMIGKIFGNLRVVKDLDERKFGEIVWLCECSCGNKTEVRGHYLRSGHTKSCGCLNRKKITKDLTGKKFGKLTAKRIADYKVEYSRSNVWVCECECGNKIDVITSRLLNGGAKSCGCTRIDILKSQTGDKHPNYNPDLTKEEREQRRGFEHELWSREVMERDDFTCVTCHERGGRMVAHHLDGYNWCKEKRFDISNGVTLCNECHKDFHSTYGYGDNTKEQFEEYVFNHKNLNMNN